MRILDLQKQNFHLFLYESNYHIFRYVYGIHMVSKIASLIENPLVVDALTANKCRLAFARVCIQIARSS